MTAPGSKSIRWRKIPHQPVATGWLIVLAGLMLGSGYLAPAQSYTVTDLGIPGNVADSAAEAHALNPNDSAVGTWWPGGSSKGSQFAFLYANGINTNLGTIKSGGYDYAIAYGINDTNEVVGQGTTSGGGGYNYHAFLWTNGVMVDLDNTGQSWSGANAINQHGQIVGFFTGGDGQTHACIFTNGTILDLGVLGGGTYSSARGVNNSGAMVGEYSDAGGNTYAFVYTNGVMTGLGSLGGTYGSAAAINDSGTIVGESWLANGQLRAFVISNGIMNSLGTFGGTNSSAAAINNGGEIVGYASDSNELVHAFVYFGSTMLNLDTVLPPNCPFTNLAYAYGINDSGQICGGGLTTNGIYDAFLATPPPLILTCSTNLTATATSPAGATVFFTATATGGCSPPTVTTDPPSGSTFPIGTNTVNVSARDLCGHTNTCSFTVTVNPPVAIASPAISTNHEFAVMLQGVSGQSFVILTSTDLVNWTPFLTNTLLSTWTNWSDPGSSTNTYRFYRVLTLP